jgi:hypothetical protein
MYLLKGKSMNKLILSMILLLSVFPALAGNKGEMFGQGNTQFSLLAGNGYAFDTNYFVIGAGVSYYVADRLGVGLSYENWSGNGPGINKTTPSIQYVFDTANTVQPYAGAFFRHAAITDLPSINSIGARAGVYFTSGSRSVIGVGFAYESYLDCQTAIYSTCSESYPEISIIFGF